MWDVLAYLFSLIGVAFTVIETIGTIIKRSSSFLDMIKFLYRYVFRKNTYYRNFGGLRIEYWLEHSKIVADEQRAKLNVQIENVSQTSFSEVAFCLDVDSRLKMIRPKNLIKEELKDGQTVRYADRNEQLDIGNLVKRQYEFSYEGKELYVQTEIIPRIFATKEIDDKKEAIGPEQLKGVSLKVTRRR